MTKQARWERTFREETVYLTDNGRGLCGAHLGSSARYTGRDISGQEVLPITAEIAALSKLEYGYTPACEECGRVAA